MPFGSEFLTGDASAGYGIGIDIEDFIDSVQAVCEAGAVCDLDVEPRPCVHFQDQRPTTTIKVVHQQRAVEMIAKYLGLLVDRMAEEIVQQIGALIEQGVNRIKKIRDLDGWKDIVLDAEFIDSKIVAD